MRRCEDCGTKIYKSVCSNCFEELYIFDEQNEFLGPVSKEFKETVDRQREIVNRHGAGMIQGSKGSSCQNHNFIEDIDLLKHVEFYWKD